MNFKFRHVSCNFTRLSTLFTRSQIQVHVRDVIAIRNVDANRDSIGLPAPAAEH